MPSSDAGGESRQPQQLRTAVRRAMLVPRVAWLGLQTPKDAAIGWSRYWSRVRSTGLAGDVLWDSDEGREFDTYGPMLTEHLDTALPIIDIGCGNGRFTRQLSTLFPSVVGVDVAPSAITLARKESSGDDRVRYDVLDGTVPGATARLAADLAPVNVFVRGVFHILPSAASAEMARNLVSLCRGGGRVFLAETNFRGSGLDYLVHLGATPRAIPEPLQRAIRDLPRPGHFGAAERSAAFPAGEWSLITDGPAVIDTTIAPGDAGHTAAIPGYVAVLEPRT